MLATKPFEAMASWPLKFTMAQSLVYCTALYAASGLMPYMHIWPAMARLQHVMEAPPGPLLILPFSDEVYSVASMYVFPA